MATSTEENYLKTILHLEEEKGAAKVGDIATELQLTSGTVTTMMHALSEQGLIDYAPRKGLKLSEEGRLSALQVVRRHRLIELFLVEVMNLDWSEVHDEAEDLEHVISDRLLDRMDEMLGRPTHDPHGDPIPDREGKVTVVVSTSLAKMEVGSYRVVRVSDESSDLLEWLNQKGLTIGQEFELSREDRAAGILEIRRAGEESLQLGLEAAEQVFVEAI
ncbi:MAG: metal-dependent transcriptional regulator [Verrucomicrobiales bacterium]|nr:metal-dependent transcriptional regulator [Verrucomicrobiales bacterium]